MKINNQNKKPEKRETFVQKTVRNAWEKKNKELDEKNKDDKEQVRQHQQHKTEIANYESLMKMLQNANANSKTTAAMNNLIPYVYKSFNKNAGTNTNRLVKTVIKQLQEWHYFKPNL